MTADPVAPGTGIRLKGGATIPPAPSFGAYRPVDLNGRHIGGIVEIGADHHIPVCVGCYQPLHPTTTHHQGKADLRLHWLGAHPGGIR